MKQYRAMDLAIFAVITVVSELLGYFSTVWFAGSAFFTLSLVVPITCLVLVRWGWPAVFYPVLGGAAYCLASGMGVDSGTALNYYATYCLGGTFILLMLLPAKLIGVDRIRCKWIFTALFAVGAWLCVYLGRSTVWAIFYTIKPVPNATATTGFSGFWLDVISLFAGVAVLLIMRKLDGMFEEQKRYLTRVDEERKDRMKYDSFGDEPVEIDEQSLSILNRDNDLYD